LPAGIAAMARARLKGFVQWGWDCALGASKASGALGALGGVLGDGGFAATGTGGEISSTLKVGLRAVVHHAYACFCFGKC
jgi:hypothetical protein